MCTTLLSCTTGCNTATQQEAQYSLLEQNAWNYDKKLKSNELFVAPLQIARRKNSETQQLQRGPRFVCTAEKGAWLGLKLTALWY